MTEEELQTLKQGYLDAADTYHAIRSQVEEMKAADREADVAWSKYSEALRESLKKGTNE